MRKIKNLFLALMLVVSMSACSTSTQETSATFKAGTYEGSATGRNGEIVVEVVLSDEAIDSVSVTSHSETEGIADPAIEQIPAAIVETQGLGVDTVSGATITSEAIIAAVSNALESAGADVEALKAADFGNGQTVAEALTALIAKIGENLNVRRLKVVEGDVLGVYVHSNRRIGVVVVLDGADEETAKHVAMHVCASKPDFVHPEDVSAEAVEHERQIQIDIAMQSGKPKEIAEKMVEGRMKKFTGEVSLTGQPFVMDPSVTVGQMLKQKGADAKSFVRLEVGEGIEKKEANFAEEVQAQIAASSK